MRMSVWGMGALATALLAQPVSALTVAEFFELPPSFVASGTAEAVYDAVADELQLFGVDALGGLDLLGAAFGGLGGGVGTSLFGAADFEASVFDAPVAGQFEDFDVAPDGSVIRVLFSTTFDVDNVVDALLGLVIAFDGQVSLEELLAEGSAGVSVSLFTGAAPVDPVDPGTQVIPLPAPVALLGFGVAALGAAGWRRRKSA